MFIGIDMNKDQILTGLDNCLLTDQELALGEEEWEEFEDPFDDWEIMFESDSDGNEMDEEEENGHHQHTAECKHGHHKH